MRGIKPRHELTTQDDLSELVRLFIHKQTRVIETQSTRLLRKHDMEGVHMARVACRRIRSVLKTLEHEDQKLLLEVKWLARKFGRVRDDDVLAQVLGKTDAHLAGNVKSRQRRRMKRLTKVLKSDRFRKILESLHATSTTLPKMGLTLEEGNERYLGASLERVKRLGHKLHNKASNAQLHKLRIRCKQLRYIAELFELSPLPYASKWTEQTAKMQDLLGAVQDEVLAIDYLEQSLADAKTVATSINHELLRHHCEMRELIDAFPAAWAEFDRTLRHQPHR